MSDYDDSIDPRDDEALALVLGFDTDEPNFARGFEAGRIWQMLRDNPEATEEVVVHGLNAEMLLRMAEAEGRNVQSRELGHNWLAARFGMRCT